MRADDGAFLGTKRSRRNLVMNGRTLLQTFGVQQELEVRKNLVSELKGTQLREPQFETGKEKCTPKDKKGPIQHRDTNETYSLLFSLPNVPLLPSGDSVGEQLGGGLLPSDSLTPTPNCQKRAIPCNYVCMCLKKSLCSKLTKKYKTAPEICIF